MIKGGKTNARIQAETAFAVHFQGVVAPDHIKEQIIEQGKTMIQGGATADAAFKLLAKEYIIEGEGDDHGA